MGRKQFDKEEQGSLQQETVIIEKYREDMIQRAGIDLGIQGGRGRVTR